MLFRRRSFDQAIAKDDFAWRNRNIASNLERFGAHWLFTDRDAVPIFPEIESAAHKVHAAILKCLPDDLGIGERKILGRDSVERLTREKRHHVLMVLGDAGDTGCCLMPPLLGKQKALGEEIEGPASPFLSSKPLILRMRFLRMLFDAQEAIGALPRAQAVWQEPCPGRRRVARKLHLLVRGHQKVPGPIRVGLAQRERRQSSGQARDGRVKPLVEPGKGCF